MRLVVFPACLLFIAAHPVMAHTASPCTHEVIRPEKSVRTRAFLEWLKAHAEETLDQFAFRLEGPSVPNLDVYIADVDNDGADEYVFPLHEGSGGYLYLWVFRRAGTGWSLAKDVPFADRIEGAHDYSGPLMKESELLVRFCGRTFISFAGGDIPNYYPETYIWERGAWRLVCDTPWLEYQRRVFKGLFDDRRYDPAHVLLDGVQRLCQSAAAPDTWLWMQSDLALASYRMKAFNTCLEHVRSAENAPAFARAPASLRKAVSTNAALCEAGRKNLIAGAGSRYDVAWLKAAVKRDPGVQLVLDRRFDGLLAAIVPDARLENGQSLRSALKLSIWLPDPAQLIEGRYIVLRGCEPHNCENKGVIWLDTATRQAIGMTAGTLASTTTGASRIPWQFWQHVELPAGITMDYVDRAGVKKEVTVPER